MSQESNAVENNPSSNLDSTIDEFCEDLHQRWKEGRLRAAGPRLYGLFHAYVPEHYPEIRTVRDLEKWRQVGLSRAVGHVYRLGRKSSDELNRVLKDYGLQPLPWRVSSKKPLVDVDNSTPLKLFFDLVANRRTPRMGWVARRSLQDYAGEHPELTTVGSLLASLQQGGLK